MNNKQHIKTPRHVRWYTSMRACFVHLVNERLKAKPNPQRSWHLRGLTASQALRANNRQGAPELLWRSQGCSLRSESLVQCSKNDEAFRSVFFWVSTISSLSVKGLVAIKLKGGKFWLQQSGLKAGLYGWFPAMPKVAFSAQIFGEDDTLDTSRRRDILFPQSFVLKAYHSDHLYKNSCANMYCIYIYNI